MDLSKTHCSPYCWISISRLFEHSSHRPTVCVHARTYAQLLLLHEFMSASEHVRMCL